MTATPVTVPPDADLDLDLGAIPTMEVDDAHRTLARWEDYCGSYGVGAFYARNPDATGGDRYLAPYQVRALTAAVIEACTSRLA